jgi:hypothetical protein
LGRNFTPQALTIAHVCATLFDTKPERRRSGEFVTIHPSPKSGSLGIHRQPSVHQKRESLHNPERLSNHLRSLTFVGWTSILQVQLCRVFRPLGLLVLWHMPLTALHDGLQERDYNHPEDKHHGRSYRTRILKRSMIANDGQIGSMALPTRRSSKL